MSGACAFSEQVSSRLGCGIAKGERPTGGHCVQCACSTERGGRSSEADVESDSCMQSGPTVTLAFSGWWLPAYTADWAALGEPSSRWKSGRRRQRRCSMAQGCVSEQSGSVWLHDEVPPCGGNARSPDHIGRAALAGSTVARTACGLPLCGTGCALALLLSDDARLPAALKTGVAMTG
jgi:hypothetical protein